MPGGSVLGFVVELAVAEPLVVGIGNLIPELLTDTFGGGETSSLQGQWPPFRFSPSRILATISLFSFKRTLMMDSSYRGLCP